jgi:hypothetical protein
MVALIHQHGKGQQAGMSFVFSEGVVVTKLATVF